MGLRQHYDVDAPWFDPFETRLENRGAERFELPIKINVVVDEPARKGQFVGPGLVNDISLSGISLETKHHLTVGQTVTLAIPTNSCPDDLCLANAFVGPATVCRVEPREGTRIRAGLTFGEPLLQNIEFVIFVDYLKTTARGRKV